MTSYNKTSFLRPFMVSFINKGKPDCLLVLAKSPCHAVQVMFRYFETYYSIDDITYDKNLPDCFVSGVKHFSDQFYKFLKKQQNGNN